MRPAAVYVGVDADDKVIYCGSGYDPPARWEDHRSKPWARYVAYWEVIAWRPNRAAAYWLERRLIRAWRPWCNLADNPHGPLWGRLSHLRARRKPR
jgi:predicted GIY-YIG superfamily endonuclease